jgi:Protein of unknown function (DUF3499)
MSFDYGARLVTVDSLAQFRHPASYDLCVTHSSSLVPPRGWRVEVAGFSVPQTAADDSIAISQAG